MLKMMGIRVGEPPPSWHVEASAENAKAAGQRPLARHRSTDPADIEDFWGWLGSAVVIPEYRDAILKGTSRKPRSLMRHNHRCNAYG